MRAIAVGFMLLALAGRADAGDWFVAAGGTGNGTSAGSPFGTVQMGIAAAMPGDIVHVAAGTYSEALQSVRAGNAGAPITIRGETGAIVTAVGRVLTLSHAHVVIEKLVLDGQYGDNDAVRIETAGSDTVLREVEVRRAQRDCVDMGAPANVLIERCLIHHCLNATGGRTDAHGVVGGAVRDLTIRDSEIHTFSGDAVQFDPGRAAPGWDRITIEGCKLWLAPLATAENGFPAGTVAGENAVDTKVLDSAPAHLTIRNVTAYGFRNGLIGNMAAFNIKERVIAELDRVTIYDSEIALRLRAPADVTVTNAVLHDVLAAVRYEDDIATPRIYSSTLGSGITNAFVEASSNATVVDGRNVLVLGALPAELVTSMGSLAVSATAFVDAAAHDYHLVPNSPAIDTGIDVPVTADRDGNERPHGAAHDVGAYEYCGTNCMPAPDAGVGGDPSSGGGETPAADGCCGASGGGGISGVLLVLVFRRRRPRLTAKG